MKVRPGRFWKNYHLSVCYAFICVELGSFFYTRNIQGLFQEMEFSRKQTRMHESKPEIVDETFFANRLSLFQDKK